MPSQNSFMDAEFLKHSAIYGLPISDAERDVFKNFTKRDEQATCFTLIDIYEQMQNAVFLICLNFDHSSNLHYCRTNVFFSATN